MTDIHSDHPVSQKNLAALYDAAAAKGNFLPFFKATSDQDVVFIGEGGRATLIERAPLSQGYFYKRETYSLDSFASLLGYYLDESMEKVDDVGCFVADIPNEHGRKINLAPQEMGKILNQHFLLEKTIDIVERESGAVVLGRTRHFGKEEQREAQKTGYTRTDLIDGYIALSNIFNNIAEERPASSAAPDKAGQTLGHYSAIQIAGLAHLRN